jgi:hypothetical protein
MILFSDARNYKICVYHSLACQILSGDGAQYKQPQEKADAISVFTVLAGKGEGGTSTYLSVKVIHWLRALLQRSTVRPFVLELQ